MPIETTDTRGDGLRPGKYTFTIATVPEKKQFVPSGKWYYDFQFEVVQHGEIVPHNEKVPTWLAAPLLRAIGAKEIEEGRFEWDKDKVVGIQFDAEIEMQKSTKSDKVFAKITNPIAIKQPVPDANVPF